jgi:HET-S-like prion-inhibition and propagation protein
MEPASISIRAADIAATFSACVQCFDSVKLSDSYGRDLQIDELRLSIAKLRLTRWGEAVNIYDDPKLGSPEATTSKIEKAKHILYEILELFSSAQQISSKYSLLAKSQEEASAPVPSRSDSKITELRIKTQELAIRRERHSRDIESTTSWVLYRKIEVERLIKDFSELIDALEHIVPASQPQLSLAREEIARLNDEQSLTLVKKAAQNIDSLFQSAAEEALTGHQSFNVAVNGKVHYGDMNSSDGSGAIIGASHSYSGVQIEKEGKVFVGNSYGGINFWHN